MLLSGWREDAAAHERVRSEVEILCLQAQALDAAGDPAKAAQALTRALSIGEAKGLRRLFLDQGEGLARLLKKLIPGISRRPLAVYAAGLLPGSAPAVQSPPAALVEPLSAQELRVLRLLAAGLSNPEIARELVVSTNTIKTQVKSIFRKLSVSTRREARDAARELNLL
jgi:LuxR family transcriptional regulator, maltose regulon positive regulatory protein